MLRCCRGCLHYAHRLGVVAGLGVTAEDVGAGVDALSHLLCDAAKVPHESDNNQCVAKTTLMGHLCVQDGLKPVGFAKMVGPHGFSEESTKILFQVSLIHTPTRCWLGKRVTLMHCFCDAQFHIDNQEDLEFRVKIT